MEITFKNLARVWVGPVALVLLSACGGGANDQTGNASPSAAPNINAGALPSFLPTSNAPPSAQTIALQMEGGRLNSQELAQIAATGILPTPFDGPLLSGAQDLSKSIEKSNVPVAQLPQIRMNATLGAPLSAASLTPAYRFYNSSTLGHFYTTSTAERNNLITNVPVMKYEGPSFFTSPTSVTGLSPVHRFYNTQNGVHFFTISESERAFVAANFPNFKYEGIAYYASTTPDTGLIPLYRFYYKSKGFHFYTSNLAERDNIIATLPSYTYEGVSYYVWSGSGQAIPPTPGPVSGSLNGWTVTRSTSSLENTVSCSLSKVIGTNSSLGLTAYFRIDARSNRAGARSSSTVYPQDDIEAPYFNFSYCSSSTCYGTNGTSLLKVDTFPTRSFNKLNDATIQAHQAAFLARGDRLLTTDQSPDRYEGLLDELGSGKSLTVRAVPNNQYFPTIEGTISLQGYPEMLVIFNRCSAGRPAGLP